MIQLAFPVTLYQEFNSVTSHDLSDQYSMLATFFFSLRKGEEKIESDPVPGGEPQCLVLRTLAGGWGGVAPSLVSSSSACQNEQLWGLLQLGLPPVPRTLPQTD